MVREGHLIFSLVVSVPDCAMQTSAKVRCPQLRVLTVLVPGSCQLLPGNAVDLTQVGGLSQGLGTSILDSS